MGNVQYSVGSGYVIGGGIGSVWASKVIGLLVEGLNMIPAFGPEGMVSPA